MKKIFTLSGILLLMISTIAWGQPVDIKADYGPPEEANTWTKYTFPLTAETFGVSEDDLEAVLSNVNSLWIRTEMHTGNDAGGIDNVMVGSSYSSYFDAWSEGWSSGGDGTMEWVSTEGYEGGFLQITDWATGDYHYLISPASWAGDWSSMIGENIEFWFKTNQPSYSAYIMITTEDIERLILGTPVSATVLPDDSVLMELEVLPVPDEDVTVTFSSSNEDCIQVPSSITIPAGESIVYLYFKAAPGAEVGCSSVIEAEASGYVTSRITMMVYDNFGIDDESLSDAISIYPNPGSNKVILSNSSNKAIQLVKLYDMSGNLVLELENPDLSNTEIDISGQPAGIYFLRVFAEDKTAGLRLVVK